MSVTRKITYFILSILVFSFSIMRSVAQQLPQFSQYMYNDFVLNPGATGIREQHEIRLLYRNQWAGFENAPVTQTLSYNVPFLKNNGIGTYIFNDVTGPTSNIGAALSFAHHLQVTRTDKVSLGLAFKVFNYRLDLTKFKLKDAANDQVIAGGNSSLIVPDLTFGIYYSGRRSYIGISLPNLIEAKTNFNDYKLSQAQLARHFFYMMGTKLKVNDNLEFEPSMFIKAVKGANPQIDFNGKLIFNNQFWVGGAYRTGDATIGLVGFKLPNGLNFGYSFDYTLTDISKVAATTHEFVLGFDFGGVSKSSSPY